MLDAIRQDGIFVGGFPRSGSTPPSEPALPQEPTTPMPVLVADDDRLTRSLLVERLTAWGYAPVPVTNGGEALGALARRNGPPLAILDWEMPSMTGVQVCRAMQAKAAERYTYILMITGGNHPQELVNALDAGAADFVRKPINEAELRARLRAGARIIELHSRFMQAQAELEQRALQDPLTGLANRFAINQAMERELARSTRKGTPLSVVLFDIDNFKRINDGYGHAVGDDVLTGTAVRCRGEVRAYDVLGRHGGEEFLLVAPDCGIRAAVTLAERMRNALCSSRIHSGSLKIPITASFGAASTEQGHETVQRLLVAADEALYRAKRAGRNRTEAASTADAVSTRNPRYG
jgi:two-component system cell cycle response regulator